jgi:altronate dehydratase
VIPTAECADDELKHIVANYRKPYWIDAVRLLDYHLSRPKAVSQDEYIDILSGLACSPNTAGVLLAIRCRENMSVTDVYSRTLAASGRVMCIVLYGEGAGKAAAEYLDDLAAASPRLREEFPISELCVGIYGAFGGYSGLAVNHLLGRLADHMASQGAAVLASCPITEKSHVTGSLRYGETAPSSGGMRIVPSSGELASDCVIFAAGGAQLILAATAGKTPFAGVVPTAIISSAHEADSYSEYTDFAAGNVFMKESVDDAAKHLEDYVMRVACGEKVSNERRAHKPQDGAQ